MSLYKYIYFYFLIGFYINKNNIVDNYMKKDSITKIIMLIVMLTVYCLLLSLYDYNSYIYTSGMNVINNYYQIYINIYRWLIGLVGIYCLTAFVFIVESYITQKALLLPLLGKASIIIYILDCFINKILLLINIQNYNPIYVIFEAIIILIFCTIIYLLIKQSKTLSKLLIGN